MTQSLSLTPEAMRILARCPLHYHFLQQEPTAQAEPELAKLVRETIQWLHAAGGPARLSLERCLARVAMQPLARPIIERYYQQLVEEWPNMIAGNETLNLRIVIVGISLDLKGTLDRLDKTPDGGILAILFRLESDPPSNEAELRYDPAMTIYHALVAANYPHKRPVRLQEWWLQSDQRLTVELSEAEYRRNLGHFRAPIQALARGEVTARPGLHCDTCSFKHHGCPVYLHEVDPLTGNDQKEGDDLDVSLTESKINLRKWIFKL